MEWKIKTTSKINLFLDVLNKRNDGYHNIQSLFLEIDLGDILYIERDRTGYGLKLDTINKNLDNLDNSIYKIWNILPSEIKANIGIKVYLDKKVPLGSGLGAGSSDAVFFLTAINETYNLNLSYEDMHNICRQIGADMPFFIKGGLQYVSGIGDILKTILERDKLNNKNEFYLLIINLGIPINTKTAYSKLNRNNILNKDKEHENIEQIKKIINYINRNEYNYLSNIIYNAFEDIIFSEYPELFKIKSDLISEGACCSLMSGSGSSIYGIFDDTKKLKNAYNHFLKMDINCFISKPLIK